MKESNLDSTSTDPRGDVTPNSDIVQDRYWFGRTSILPSNPRLVVPQSIFGVTVLEWHRILGKARWPQYKGIFSRDKSVHWAYVSMSPAVFDAPFLLVASRWPSELIMAGVWTYELGNTPVISNVVRLPEEVFDPQLTYESSNIDDNADIPSLNMGDTLHVMGIEDNAACFFVPDAMARDFLKQRGFEKTFPDTISTGSNGEEVIDVVPEAYVCSNEVLYIPPMYKQEDENAKMTVYPVDDVVISGIEFESNPLQ